ncbi:hypothetical protein HQ563_12615 [bacterium]|nr:hypothetical protein [bacterium]
MKRILVIPVIAMLLWQGAPAFPIEEGRARGGDAQQFIFKFEPNRPLLYAMKVRMKIDMDMQMAMQSMKMKMEFELRWKFKLVPKDKPSEDLNTVRLEPSGLEGDWDITGPAGHIVMKLRGSDVTGTQDGVTTIDTKRGIGLSEARQVKTEISGLYLSGEIDIDSRGNVVNIRGDVPFVEFWTEACEGQPGIFGVVFPEKPVATGDTWKEFIVLKKMGEVLLEEPGLRCTVALTRQPDTTARGRKISRFAIEAPFKQRNLVAYMHQAGQRIQVDIPTFDRSASGTARFDAERQVLIDSHMKIDAKAHMEMSAAGEGATIDMVMGAVTDLALLPDSGAGGL